MVIEVMNRLSVSSGISGKEFHCYVVCTFPIFLSRIELRKLDAPGNDRGEEVKKERERDSRLAVFHPIRIQSSDW